jgi:hypothetical protein
MSLWYGGALFGYMLRSNISGSSDTTISNFLRNHHTDFQCGCTSLQSHQQWRSVLLSLHPRQHMLLLELLILAILICIRYNLWVVLICISLMTKNSEYFFKCFLAIQGTSVENAVYLHTPPSPF